MIIFLVKKFLAVVGFVVLTFSALTGYADCSAEIRQADQVGKNGIGLQKKNLWSEAEVQYKRAARQLANLKYRCDTDSLREISAKEKYYRALAKQAECGEALTKGTKLAETAKVAESKSAKHARTLSPEALEAFNSVITNCPNTALAAQAKKAMTIVKTNSAKASPEVQASKTLVKRNACFTRHLLVAVGIEEGADQALSGKRFNEAVSKYEEAATQYELNSNKCTVVKERLGVLDRVKTLRARVLELRAKYLSCDHKSASAKDYALQAYKDEQEGEYDLAQIGYRKAINEFRSLPPSCPSEDTAQSMKETEDKLSMLDCKPYTVGIKDYNLAFQAMEKIENSKAASHFAKAKESFDRALKECKPSANNHKLLSKLKAYSIKNAERFGK